MARVLIAEDEFLVADLAEDIFESAGFEVVCEVNGDRALEQLASNGPFDLLFTDICMPGQTNGWDLGRRAREINPGIKVIYATGFSEERLSLQPDERFLPKPYRGSAVLAAARELGVDASAGG